MTGNILFVINFVGLEAEVGVLPLVTVEILSSFALPNRGDDRVGVEAEVGVLPSVTVEILSFFPLPFLFFPCDDDDNEDSSDESDSENNHVEVVAVLKGKASNDDGSSTNQSEDEDDDDNDDADGTKQPAANKSNVAPMSVATMKTQPNVVDQRTIRTHSRTPSTQPSRSVG